MTLAGSGSTYGGEPPASGCTRPLDGAQGRRDAHLAGAAPAPQGRCPAPIALPGPPRSLGVWRHWPAWLRWGPTGDRLLPRPALQPDSTDRAMQAHRLACQRIHLQASRRAQLPGGLPPTAAHVLGPNHLASRS